MNEQDTTNGRGGTYMVSLQASTGTEPVHPSLSLYGLSVNNTIHSQGVQA